MVDRTLQAKIREHNELTKAIAELQERKKIVDAAITNEFRTRGYIDTKTVFYGVKVIETHNTTAAAALKKAFPVNDYPDYWNISEFTQIRKAAKA